MTRKGQAEMLEWFPRLLLMLVAVIVIAMLVRYFADRAPDTAELHRSSYLYRMHYDGDLFTHKDDFTDRVYPGMVDLDRLETSRLDEVFGRNGKISSHILVTSPCGNKEAWHDKETWEQHIGFARFGTIGPGSATLQEEIWPVTVVNDGQQCSGTLNITIVRPNT